MLELLRTARALLEAPTAPLRAQARAAGAECRRRIREDSAPLSDLERRMWGRADARAASVDAGARALHRAVQPGRARTGARRRRPRHNRERECRRPRRRT